MDPNTLQNLGPWGATIVAVATVLVQYLQGRQKVEDLNAKVDELTVKFTEASRDAEKYKTQVREWEVRESRCQQSLVDSDRKLMEKERQTLALLIEIRDMQSRVIELQKELDNKRRGKQ